MKVALVTGFLGLSLLAAGPAVGAQQAAAPAPAAANYTVVSAIPYTTGAQGPLLADVYVPTAVGLHPGVIFIHGGGWKNGDRNQMVKIIKEIASAGYSCMTIEYDVDPVHFPASFHQSLAALRFFRDHAAEYHLDPAHVAVAGSSAGGELAALVALDPAGTPLGAPAGNSDSAGVQAALIFNGALDLTPIDPSRGTAVSDYLGVSCTDRMDVCKAASPLYQVHAGAPPFYVGHGTVDQSVPFGQAVAFTDALKAAGVPVEFFVAKDGKHTYWADPRFYDTNVINIKAFLAKYLGGHGAAS